MSDKAHQAAELLIATYANPAAKLASLPEGLRPADKAEAVAIQQIVVRSFGAIGGWKVGASGPDAVPQCSALPAVRVVSSPASFDGSVRQRWIETEVSFTIGHDLPPRAEPYTREEIIAAMATAHPTIELLDPRYVDADAVDPFSALADSQSHYALIVGPGRADWHGIDFQSVAAEQYVNGALHKTYIGNPAGDMVRLVQWTANVGAVWDGGLKKGQVVTCGSWTGKSPVAERSAIKGFYAPLGEAVVQYT